MKKIIYLLIITLLLSMISGSPTFANEATDERIKVVADLGIITGDEANNLMLEKNITRAEAAVIVYRLKNPNAEGEIRASRQIFSDVDINHWAAGEIEFLYDTNIVSGDENGAFRPNACVSTAELYKMLLYVAGYGERLKNTGAYPENVMQMAAQKGLNKSLALSSEKQLIRKEAFLILYNLLKIDTLILKSYDEGRPIYKDGGEFLSSVLDIYTYKGIVTGAENVSSGGEEIPDGMVEIDGELFVNEAGLTVDSIGKSGEYYLKEDKHGEQVVLCFIPQKDNIIEIYSEDLISYSQNEYVYTSAGGRKRVELNPKKDIYYNNHTVLSEFYTVSVPRVDADGNPVIDSITGNQIIDKVEKSYMMPEYGKIKLIDNDGDRRYDAVMINDYQNVLCDYVNDSSMTIYGISNGEKVNVELDSLDEYTIKNTDGTTVSLRSIKKDTLVMLQYYDNNKGLTVTVCENTAEGEITDVNYEEHTVKLNGKDYKFAASNAKGKEDIRMKSKAILHLDIYGNIGAVTYLKSEWIYGFVIRVKSDENDEVNEITLVNSAGEIKDYPCAEKMKVDGSRVNDIQLRSMVTEGSVIRFFLNGAGKINMIDTPSPKPITEWDGTYAENDTLLERVKKTNNTMCKTTNRAFYSNKMTIFYDDNTIFLRVPEKNGEDGYTQYDNYKVLKDTSLVHKGIYTIAAYNTDPDKITADYAVIYEDEKKIAEGSHFMLVDMVNEVNDENDEITFQIKGLYDGQVVSYNLKEPSLINIGTHEIQRGDVLKIRLVSKKITNVELIYSIEEPYCKESRLGPGKNTTTSTSYNAEEKFEFGWVERVQAPNIVFKRNTTNASENPYSFYKGADTFYIYIYDVNEKKSPVSMGTINDIKSKERYFDECDTAIAGVESTNGQTLILVRYDEGK